MSSQINSNSITINSSAQKVWFALTNSNVVNKYLPNVKVVSSWELGSRIVYTCYDKDGEVYQWNGKPMIWSGEITAWEINKTLEIDYTDQSQGVTSESYILKSIDDNTTELTFTQTLVSQEMANSYKDGNQYTLDALKKYCEQNNSTNI